MQQEHFAVPTLEQRGFFGSGATGLYLPGAAFASSPFGDAVFSLFPFPNNSGGPYGRNTYTEMLPANSSGNLASLKLDHSFTHWGQLSVRYSIADEGKTLPVTGNALDSGIRATNRDQLASATLANGFGGTWSNTLRVSYGWASGRYEQPVPDASQQPSSLFPQVSFLLNKKMYQNVTTPNSPNPEFLQTGQSTEAFTGPVGEVNVMGYSPIGVDVNRFPQKRGDGTFQVNEIAERVFHPAHEQSHTLTFGAQFWDLAFNDAANRYQLPQVVYGGQNVITSPNPAGISQLIPGNAASQNPLLLPTDMVAVGIPSAYYQTLASPQAFTSTGAVQPLNLRRKQLDLFVNDGWRATPNLRITAGFRLELNGEPNDAAGRLQANYSTNLQPLESGFLADCQSGFASTPGVNSLGYCQSYYNYLTAALPPTYQQVFGQNPRGKDVRLGFARTFGNRGQTVIRGGWGVYTGQFPDVILSETASYFPQVLPLRFNFTPLGYILANKPKGCRSRTASTCYSNRKRCSIWPELRWA